VFQSWRNGDETSGPSSILASLSKMADAIQNPLDRVVVQ
jgi:hypothetical protein